MKELLTGLTSADIRKLPDFHQVTPDYRAIEDISNNLQSTVFGQEQACNQLARAVTRSMAGMSDPKRPEMTAMFLGPTGVGKTEMAKGLAKYLYGNEWEQNFLRIDCTQLQESHSVGRLKGAEPNYVGYGDNNMLITPEFLSGGGVILLDEIEKAHPAIWKWFLPVMEEGEQKALVPSKDKQKWSSELTTLDFSSTYLIMTANVGAEALHKARTGSQMGFHGAASSPDMEKIGQSELKKHFQGMPEFLGRIDSTVVFNDLERPSYELIFNKFIDEINVDQRYGANFLAVTHELRDYVLDHAQTGEFGAREIRHKINTYVLDKASEIKYSGVLKSGQPLIGDLEDDKVVFWTSDLALNNQGNPVEAHMPEKKPSGKKNRDSGSFIGNKEDVPEEPLPTEKDTGEEDIKKPQEKEKPVDMVHLLVTYDDGSTEDLGEFDRWMSDNLMAGFAMGDEMNGKRVASAKQVNSSEFKKPAVSLGFYKPFTSKATIDLVIRVKQPGEKDLEQVLTGLPLL
jgi:ATP-dependent protease Clp ATPase subunit